jgi:hypothetical protein
MDTVSKFPRQLAPTVGQHAVATGVKFRPGPSSALGEKVASGLVWRFGTFDCISDNLDYFKDGLGDNGSFLDVGSHRFYVAKPFPEEVTDVLDPLSDTGSDCSESSDFCTMVKVLALEDDGGGDLPRSACPPLERPPPQEQDLPPPERDVLDAAITDLRTPLDLTADPSSSPRIWSGRTVTSSRKRLASRTLVGASSPCSMSTTPPRASPRPETVPAGRHKFVNEAASWVRS